MTAQEAKTTTDCHEIRRGIEERCGKPATVRGTGDGGEAGVLRIAFIDSEDLEAIEAIDWSSACALLPTGEGGSTVNPSKASRAI